MSDVPPPKVWGAEKYAHEELRRKMEKRWRIARTALMFVPNFIHAVIAPVGRVLRILGKSISMMWWKMDVAHGPRAFFSVVTNVLLFLWVGSFISSYLPWPKDGIVWWEIPFIATMVLATIITSVLIGISASMTHAEWQTEIKKWRA